MARTRKRAALSPGPEVQNDHDGVSTSHPARKRTRSDKGARKSVRGEDEKTSNRRKDSMVSPVPKENTALRRQMRSKKADTMEEAEEPAAGVAEGAGQLSLSPPREPNDGDVESQENMVSDRFAWLKQEYGQEHGSPMEVALRFLARRLHQPGSPEAATLMLRPGLEEIATSLSSSLQGAVELGHGTSALVVGPRGSGKTLALERAVRDLLQRYNSGSGPNDARVGVVRLYGWAHSDERLAFREAARQLCSAFGAIFKRSASVGENIEFLREMLDCLSRAQKCVIFVLEDFEAWVRRPRQTLLYGLLDALSCSGVRAAVVGTAVRSDVTSLLEKRVRSRFSHRSFPVPVPSPEDGVQAMRGWLALPKLSWPDPDFCREFNAGVESTLCDQSVIRALGGAAEAGTGLAPLARIAAATLRVLRRTEVAPNRKSSIVTPAVMLEAVSHTRAEDNASARCASKLSVLELILAVAAHRVTARQMDSSSSSNMRQDTSCFNFRQVYAEFRRFSNLRGQHVDGYTLGAAQHALDTLLAVGVLGWAHPARTACMSTVQRQYAPMYLTLAPAELQSALSGHSTCPLALREWFAKEGGLVEMGTTMSLLG